jgi:Flp pilus assembly protein CpaB
VKKKSPPYAFIAAAVLFIIAAIILWKWKQSQDAAAAAAVAAQQAADQAKIDEASRSHVAAVVSPTNMRSVLYATQPLAPGALISPGFFEKKDTPDNVLPDAYTDGDKVVGLYVLRPIEPGDPLTHHNVGSDLPIMSQRITPGMRIIELPVIKEANDSSGFIVDGDKVDLLYTIGATTQLVMQNVNVFYVPAAANNRTDQSAGLAPIEALTAPVVFQVTPEQAQALIGLSQGTGRFSMLLRARKDQDEIHIRPFDRDDYTDNLKRIQKLVDTSNQRVDALAAAIQAKEQSAAAQGNTNETTTPTLPPPTH